MFRRHLTRAFGVSAIILMFSVFPYTTHAGFLDTLKQSMQTPLAWMETLARATYETVSGTFLQEEAPIVTPLPDIKPERGTFVPATTTVIQQVIERTVEVEDRYYPTEVIEQHFTYTTNTVDDEHLAEIFTKAYEYTAKTLDRHVDNAAHNSTLNSFFRDTLQTGDMLYVDTQGDVVPLHIGGQGSFLTSIDNLPSWQGTSTMGLVTSVALSAPTGFTVSNSPITTSGTLTLSYDTGYEGLLTASSTNWNSFFNTPSTRITDGTGITWSGNTLDLDVNSLTEETIFTSGDFLVFYDTTAGAVRKVNYDQLPGAGGGLTALNGLTDASQAFATTSDTNIGFTITSSGSTHTFTSTWSGTLAVSRGGTGLGTLPQGEILIGNGTSALTSTTTTNLKNSLALNLVENTALSTWVGTTNITTLGTITSGTWQGTAITPTYLDASVILASEIDSLSELETLASVTNILLEEDIDASSELSALVDDETGTGSLVFSASPSFSGTANFDIASSSNASTTGLTAQRAYFDIVEASSQVKFINSTPTIGRTYELTSEVIGGDAGFTITDRSNSIRRLVIADGGGTIVGGVSGVSDSGDVSFAVNSLDGSVQRFTVLSNGNVGIGTTSPSAPLHVSGNDAVIFERNGSGAQSSLSLFNNASAVGDQAQLLFQLNHASQGRRMYAAISGEVEDGTGSADGALVFKTASNGSYGTEYMRLTSSGNLGVGTSTPTTRLGVKVTANDDGILLTESGSSNKKLFKVFQEAGDDGRMQLFQDNIAVIQFTGRSGQNSYIANGGYVGIGTTTPGYLFDVYGPSRFADIMRFGTDQGSITWGAGVANAFNVGGGTGKALSLGANNLPDMVYLSTGGNVGVGTTTPSTKLSVYGSASFGDGSQGVVSVSQDGHRFNFSRSSANHINANTTGGYLSFGTNGSDGGMILSVDNDLTVAGRVFPSSIGIGTTGPDELLHIEGNILLDAFSTGAGSGIFFREGYASGDASPNNLSIRLTDGYGADSNGLADGFEFNAYEGFGFHTQNGAVTAMVITEGGSVGVGTSSPRAKLEILGTGNGADVMIDNNGGRGGGIAFAQNGIQRGGIQVSGKVEADTSSDMSVFSEANLRMYTGGSATERLFIDTSGRVGIGTSSPAYNLEVYGTTPRIGFGSDGTTENWFLGTDYSPAGFGLYNRTDSAYRLFVDNSGNTGIGTTNPGDKLHVLGSGTAISSDGVSSLIVQKSAAAGTYAGIAIVSGNAAGARVSFGDTDAHGQGMIEYDNANNSLDFYTNNSERLTISSTGGVGIGTTTPGTKLEVAGAIRGGLFAASQTNTGEAWLGRPSDGTLGEFVIQLGGASETGTGFRIVDRAWSKTMYSFSGEAPVGALTVIGSGNLGIGTTSPSEKLDIYGITNTLAKVTANSATAIGGFDARADSTAFGQFFTTGSARNTSIFGLGSDANLSVLYSGGADSVGLALGTHSSDPIIFGTNNVERMRVTAAGNVGIGTTSPQVGLDVLSNTGVRFSGTSGGPLYMYLSADAGEDIADKWVAAIADGGLFTLQSFASGSWVEKLAVTTGGNVGIGTTTPTSDLHIADPDAGVLISHSNSGSKVYYKVTNDLSGYIQMEMNGSTFGATGPDGVAVDNSARIITNGASRLRLGTIDSNPLDLSTNNYARLTVSGAGDIGIGTTTPTAQLHTTGSVRFSTFGAGTLQTDANGNLSVSSDIRLKVIEGDYITGIEALLGIEPIQYHWASSTGFDTNTLYTGFSAQNVKDFIPEAVGEDKNGFLTLSDRPLMAAVINAVKEIWAKVLGHDERIEELELRIKTLEEALEIENIEENSGGNTADTSSDSDGGTEFDTPTIPDEGIIEDNTETPSDEVSEPEVVSEEEPTTEQGPEVVTEEEPESESLPDENTDPEPSSEADGEETL